MDDKQSGSKPPVEVAGYEIIRELGRGGFAVVYLAKQPVLNRTVALKVLTHIDPNDADALHRFEAECQAIGSLSWHPHVVTVYDVGRTADGRPFMAMENLPSGSLQTKLHEHGSAPWTEAVRVGIQIADALAAAHDEGILHRDVKPANVLTDRLGEYRLADFGIARFGEVSRTATGVITGTIAYTAPDVLAGARHSVQADLYSLGAMLHCLVTGKTPFVGDNDESLVTIMFRATTEPAPSLLSEGVPPLFAALVDGLMAKDPARRPSSAIEVGQWFQKIQQENGLAVTPLRSAPNAQPAAPAGAANYTGGMATPAPTSSTPPPPGRWWAASVLEGVGGPDPARRARDRNSPTGNSHGDSGAAARISEGMAQPSSCSRQRARAPPACPSMGGRLPRPAARQGQFQRDGCRWPSRVSRGGVAIQAVSRVLACPCRQNTLTCSTGPSVDGHTQRETTSAATSQPGSGQATIWFMVVPFNADRAGRRCVARPGQCGAPWPPGRCLAAPGAGDVRHTATGAGNRPPVPGVPWSEAMPMRTYPRLLLAVAVLLLVLGLALTGCRKGDSGGGGGYGYLPAPSRVDGTAG